MNKKRRVIIITLSALTSTIVSYFGFGLIGVGIANEAIINRRTELSLLEEDFYCVQKTRKDYPSLSNREEITFKCGNETLIGYLYERPSPKGIIIFAHGVNNLADANSSQMHNYYLNHGYDIFAIDMTGCGRSTGKGIKTLYESRYCVKNAVKTVQNLDKCKDLPLFLIGHSWGGYGVVSASDDVEGVLGVASFSGYNVPADMMYGFAETYATKAISFLKPSVNFGLAVTWGDQSFYPAEQSIKNNADITYFVIHGEKDNTVPYKTYSLYDHIKDDNYSNVKAISIPDMYHGTPWKTVEAANYTSQCEKDLKNLRKKYKGEALKQAREEYIKNVDLEKASEVNADLLNQIDITFTSLIQK